LRDGRTAIDKLLVATGNPGKQRELCALLAELSVSLITPQEAGLHLSVTEDGESYVENACKKAVAYARASGLITLADDSGLEVEALMGEPGLHSRRYVPGVDATDSDRRGLLLARLAGKPRPWRAQFRAAVAIAIPGGKTHWAEGSCEGEIEPQERGSGGFGYDPIFVVAGTGLTMAELDLTRKNRLSHRGRAVANALPILRQLFP
jgi:XTP/dITP diphosphohydrolase